MFRGAESSTRRFGQSRVANPLRIEGDFGLGTEGMHVIQVKIMSGDQGRVITGGTANTDYRFRSQPSDLIPHKILNRG